MSTGMIRQNIPNDLTFLEAMASELEEYILAGDVFRMVLIDIGAGFEQYQMSGGDVLGRILVLQAIYANLTGEQKDRLNSIVAQFETTKYELQTRFQQLLQRELKARLDMLEWSIDEIEENDDVLSPADRRNLRRVAAIRQELGKNIPRETIEELNTLEHHLRAEIELLHQGEPETPDQ